MSQAFSLNQQRFHAMMETKPFPCNGNLALIWPCETWGFTQLTAGWTSTELYVWVFTAMVNIYRDEPRCRQGLMRNNLHLRNQTQQPIPPWQLFQPWDWSNTSPLQHILLRACEFFLGLYLLFLETGLKGVWDITAHNFEPGLGICT